MFPTFSGTSRRPRQVNLSGRNNNPFAAIQQTPHGQSQGSPSAVALAQQERRARQLERERLQAARAIQKTWRGHVARQAVAEKQRVEWDEQYRLFTAGDPDSLGQASFRPEDTLKLLRLLCQFASPQDRSDHQRIALYTPFLSRTLSTSSSGSTEWGRPVNRLLKLLLTVVSLRSRHIVSSAQTEDLILISELLQLLITIVTRFSSSILSYDQYYSVLASLFELSWAPETKPLKDKLHILVCTPLTPADQPEQSASASKHRTAASSFDNAYLSFCIEFLTMPGLQERVDFDMIGKRIDMNELTKVVKEHVFSTLRSGHAKHLENMPLTKQMWFLAYYIAFNEYAVQRNIAEEIANNIAKKPYSIHESSRIIKTLAAQEELLQVVKRPLCFMEIVTYILSRAARESQDDSGRSGELLSNLPGWVEAQISSLIQRGSLQAIFESSDDVMAAYLEDKSNSERAAIRANYVLALLWWKSDVKDQILSWLYFTKCPSRNQNGTVTQVPAVKFFWSALEATELFQTISQSPKSAVVVIRTARDASKGSHLGKAWKIGLLFLELYSFVIQLTDDEEFFHGASTIDSDAPVSRQSALSIRQVKRLIIFLKHLAYAIYWHFTDIFDPTGTEAYPLGLRQSSQSPDSDVLVPGVGWASVTYVKNRVTGLLRSLYDRDSRRPFLTKGFWTIKEFDMQGLTGAMVLEQQRRINHGEDEEMDDEDDEAEPSIHRPNLIGTGLSQQQIRSELMRRQNQQTSRDRTMKSVTPRLEILRNMPFFIPFPLRVQIFREFIFMDQQKRRDGITDTEQWRLHMEGASFDGRMGRRGYDVSRHDARVRRGHVFEDAFVQYYPLGDGLKEPIKIEFIDQFDTPEAGVDGGGVTKEFLTSVSTEAFATSNGPSDYFVENDQHLLYPNPGIFDSREDFLREAGLKEGTPESREEQRALAQRFEFLGRIVGKCLYEGILIDIHFAPFFLVKWALTGGTGFAPKESSYQASINDLRDLDEAVYRSLVGLYWLPIGCILLIHYSFSSKTSKVTTSTKRSGWTLTSTTSTKSAPRTAVSSRRPSAASCRGTAPRPT